MHILLDETDIKVLLEGDAVRKGDFSVCISGVSLKTIEKLVEEVRFKNLGHNGNRTVHLMDDKTRAACGFLFKAVRSIWPAGHTGTNDPSRVTCEGCNAKLLTMQKADS